MIAIVLAAAAAVPGPVAEASPAIDRANSEWLPALKAGDAATLAAPYAPNAVFLLPDGTQFLGHEAIQAMYARRGKATGVTSGVIQSRGRAALSHDLVLEWGDGSLTRRDESGAARTIGGPYVTTWARQPDGSWKIVRNLVF